MWLQEQFVDTNGVIRIRKNRQNNDQKKKVQKDKTIVDTTLHRKLKTEQHEPHEEQFKDIKGVILKKGTCLFLNPFVELLLFCLYVIYTNKIYLYQRVI